MSNILNLDKLNGIQFTGDVSSDILEIQLDGITKLKINVTSLRCNVTSISSLSDARDKKDITDNPYGLDFINSIKSRQFTWETREGNMKDGETNLGFIAQELLEATNGNNNVLDLVYQENPEKLEIKQANLIPILVKAIQELSDKIKELES